MSQMTLSGRQVSHNPRPYCPGDSPVSRSVLPGSEKAQRMTVTSGLKCFDWCRNSGRLGLLERMLLGSSVWHSMRCVLTWNVQVTPAGRSYFRLRGSVPRTREIGSSLWPTPAAAQADRPIRPFAPSECTLEHGIMLCAAVYDSLQENPQRMWPTPHANCHTGAGDHGDGGMNLQTAVQGHPTPSASMRTLGDLNQARFAGSDSRRPDYATANQMFPTPTANDAKNATLPPGAGKRDSLPGELIRSGASGSLNPLWVEWLMGFPPGWTDCDVSETR